MPRITPSLAYDATPEQRNAYHRLYRRRNLEKMRAYGRNWQRKRRRKLRTSARKRA